MLDTCIPQPDYTAPRSCPALPCPSLSNGYLDVTELARFFRDLFRNMPAYDLRLLVAHCFTADVEHDGLVRPDELLQHLHAITMQSPSGGCGLAARVRACVRGCVWVWEGGAAVRVGWDHVHPTEQRPVTCYSDCLLRRLP